MISHPNDILRQIGVSDGMVIADLGTGSGVHARELVKHAGAQSTIYALDVQKDLVTRLAKEAREENISNLHPIWADLEEPKGTTLADGIVDLVLLSNTLFQIEHKAQLLVEAYRILRPLGRMLIVDWKESFGMMGPHPDQVVSEETARMLAEKAGFTFEKKIDAGEHHYGLLLRKSAHH